MRKWSHYTIVEAVEPFKLHPTSMSYIYMVFEHLKQLWMGIWQHIHTIITTVDVSPDLGELVEIIYDVNVITIPLHYHWGCRTFQTASRIHVIHICLNTLNSCGWAYGGTLTPLPPQRFPQIWEFAEILDDNISVEMIPLCYCWDCITFQTASHIHEIHHITHIQCGWPHRYAVHWYTSAALLHSFGHTTWFRFWGSG